MSHDSFAPSSCRERLACTRQAARQRADRHFRDVGRFLIRKPLDQHERHREPLLLRQPLHRGGDRQPSSAAVCAPSATSSMPSSPLTTRALALARAEVVDPRVFHDAEHPAPHGAFDLLRRGVRRRWRAIAPRAVSARSSAICARSSASCAWRVSVRANRRRRGSTRGNVCRSNATLSVIDRSPTSRKPRPVHRYYAHARHYHPSKNAKKFLGGARAAALTLRP